MLKGIILVVVGLVAIYLLVDSNIISVTATESATSGILDWIKGAYLSVKDSIASLV